jgi:hypothetical protein
MTHHTLKFEGTVEVRVFHLAVCSVCEPVLPIPFSAKADREIWLDVHATHSGHEVRRVTEIRIQS